MSCGTEHLAISLAVMNLGERRRNQIARLYLSTQVHCQLPRCTKHFCAPSRAAGSTSSLVRQHLPLRLCLHDPGACGHLQLLLRCSAFRACVVCCLLSCPRHRLMLPRSSARSVADSSASVAAAGLLSPFLHRAASMSRAVESELARQEEKTVSSVCCIRA